MINFAGSAAVAGLLPRECGRYDHLRIPTGSLRNFATADQIFARNPSQTDPEGVEKEPEKN